MIGVPDKTAVQRNRLSGAGLIDRRKTWSFHFDGKRYEGYAGDTLASALLASDVRVVGRSFKYHRPRGVVTAGSDEPNALVELRSGARCEPNTRATMIELFEGLVAKSQNRWPSLRFDVGAINSLFSPLLVAGFYYKTFMWPASWWEKVYEPAIRRAAGLGRASTEADPDAYEKAHTFCDVLIVGAGPAGLSAALAAGRSGARVILCEEDFILGGRLNADRREIDGMSGTAWVRGVERELASLSDVRVLSRTTVFGAYDGKTYGVLERVADHLAVPAAHQPRQRLWKIVAKRTVLATGALERSIVFGGNDRPGVMMGGAVRAYVNRFAVAPGRRVVLFTATDDGWGTALDLKHAGIHVEAIVDTRPQTSAPLRAMSKSLGVPLFQNAQVVATRGGGRGLSHVTVLDRDRRSTRLQADALAVSGGWNPNVALSTHTGRRARWSESIAAFIPDDGLPAGMTAVGAARGSFALGDALREGHNAGVDAARSTGYGATPSSAAQADDEVTGQSAFWYVEDSRGKAFVDFQHDVTAKDIALAAREGFQSVEHLKRYTTLGMGTDQGKTSSVNALAILAALTARTIPSVGTTAFRAPYTPVAIRAFAGPHRGVNFRPTRRTPGHRWAQESGATFVEAGAWLRAQYFFKSEDKDCMQSVAREVQAVRSRVGVCDVSTLGKIDIQGPDAGIFLDRVYINTFSTLPVRKVRYGLMLREDGFVMDDGTSACLDKDRYIMSTTTVNAGKVLEHLEHARQLVWPELDVQIVSVTDQWAQYSIAGPESRHVLERLLDRAVDISDSAFPFLACAEFTWSGVPARLFRISFSGELGYELAVPSCYGDQAIRAILQAGAPWCITPYGLEAVSTMRIEKGHIAGSEMNGTTTAADLGFDRMISSKKDFIGRVLAQRLALIDPDRATLVGIDPCNQRLPLLAGAHLLSKDGPDTPASADGYITSATFSPMKEHCIGLALVKRGRERHGERLRIHDPLRGTAGEVRIVAPAFFDPDGVRLKA